LVKRRKRVRTWIGWIAAFVLLAGLGASLAAAWLAYHTASQIYQPVERLPSEPRRAMEKRQAPAGEAEEPRSAPDAGEVPKDLRSRTYLLLGVDRNASDPDAGRTDVILLAVHNPAANRLTLLSIPRDTYVEIAGKGYRDKINHSYRHGVDTVIATVENFTGIQVDHYVLFNFDGFIKTIDAIGGLWLQVDEAAAGELGIPAGRQFLDGRQALEFVRFRGDGTGDFGRNQRHQDVLSAVLEQTQHLRSPAKIKTVLDAIGQDVRTDLPFSRIITLASQAGSFQENEIVRIRYEATTARFGPQNLSYVLIREEERKRVSDELKKAAGIS